MRITQLFAVWFYLLSAGGYFAYLFFQKNWLHRTGSGLLITGFAFHTVWLVYGYLLSSHMPVSNLSETLSFSAWAVAAAFLMLHHRYKLKVLGVYSAPLVTCIMVGAMMLPRDALPAQPPLKSFWLAAHIITVFLGDAALALACGVGVLYLMQERAIKHKNPGFFFKRLPSLELLDTTGYACIVIGFTLLTIGLITGMIYAKMIWGRFWAWDPKEVWSAITWVFYAVLLHERLAVGWRGRRAAWMSIIGFGVLLFTFLGVNFWLKGHHGQFTQW